MINQDENIFIQERPMIFIIDASVCVKWFSGDKEKDIEKADLLKNQHLNKEVLLVAPDLLIFEITNALSFNPSFDFDKTSRAIDSLFLMEIKFFKTNHDLVLESIKIRFEKNITIYDAVYIAVAKKLNSQLITADRKLFEVTKGIENVILLETY